MTQNTPATIWIMNGLSAFTVPLHLRPHPKPVLDQMAFELDHTYRIVSARLPNNPALRFEGDTGKEELILSPLEKSEESKSLVALREAIAARMPQVDLTEILLEISARTRFIDAFTHVSEQSSRATDLNISLCAVMLAEACNIGIEPMIRPDILALQRDRLVWINQNYLRDETLLAANDKSENQYGFNSQALG